MALSACAPRAETAGPGGAALAFENRVLNFLLSDLKRLVDLASGPDGTGDQSEHLSLPQMEELLQLLLRCCQQSSQAALRLSQKESLSLLLRLMGNRRSSSIIVLTLRITRHVFPQLKCRVLAQVRVGVSARVRVRVRVGVSVSVSVRVRV